MDKTRDVESIHIQTFVFCRKGSKYMAIGLFKKISPEYVLGMAFADIKKSGINGLRPYLTENANKKVDFIAAGMDIVSGVGKLVGAAGGSDDGSGKATKFLMEKLSECEFDYKDLLKGSNSAKAVISFKYKDIMEGTVDISMIKQDKEWKIDTLTMPHFDKLALPQSAKTEDAQEGAANE